MMTFVITTIDEHKQTRSFMYGLDNLEANLDVIDKFLAMGHILLSVQLLDRNRVIDLPVETFDDISASTILNQLKTQWEAILAE